MSGHLTSFAIAVDDVERARAFYEAVFGWVFEAWGPPGFYLIHIGDGSHAAAHGILHKRRETGVIDERPSWLLPTFSVDDLEATATAVSSNGGTLTVRMPSAPFGGSAILFEDPEGNPLSATGGASRLPS